MKLTAQLLRKAFLCVLVLQAAATVAASNENQELASKIVNYKLYSSQMSTGGKLSVGAIPLLSQQGFNAVLDLRQPEEGTEEEQAEATESGLRYFNLPLGRELPTEADLQRFRQIIESPENQPILVHCGSGNRVGTAWSMYRIQEGVRPDQAIKEGATMGMKDENATAVREHFAP